MIGTPDKLIWKGAEYANDNIQGDVEFAKGSEALLDLDCNKQIEARFAINQLLAVMPKKDIAELTGLQFTNDMPLTLTLFTNMGIDTHTRFFIAPVIETDY